MNGKKPLDDNVWRDNLRDAVNIINTNKNFLFSGDIDPDSVGSMLSLSLYPVSYTHLTLPTTPYV